MNPRTLGSQKTGRWLLLGGLFLIAVTARLWRLTYHSLWFDETVSVLWASQPAVRIWEVGMRLVEDKHPPLYHLLLRAWMTVFGTGDAAVRSLGATLGAVAVLPVFGIGQLLGNRRVAALSALLVALNPFLIWYSQEVRMFMPAATFGLFGLYGLLSSWKAWHSCSAGPAGGGQGVTAGISAPSLWGGWAVALVGLVCTVYSYLFGVFFLVVAGVWLTALYLVSWRGPGPRTTWRPFAWGCTVIAAAMGLVLPLLWQAWQVSSSESAPGPMFGEFGATLSRLLAAYTLHQGPWADWAVMASQIVAGLLLLAGMVLPIERRSNPEGLPSAGRPLLTLYLWVPLLIGGVMLVRDGSIFAAPRYFTFLVPALCLLWGRGIAALLDRFWPLGVLALAGMLAVTIVGISHLWLPQNLREDWRTAADYVETHAGPNDTVVTHVDYMHIPFEHYFGGPQPVFYPFTEQLTDVWQVEPPLVGLLPFDTVWLVQSHTEQFDADHLVERWLADRFPLATEQYPSGVTVKGYITHYRLPELPLDVPRFDERFGGDITLAGCAVHETSTAATDQRSHPPSGWVHVGLYWQAERRPPEDYVATARMVDGVGQIWGEGLYRERDTLRVWPTSRWEAGEIVRQEVDVNLNPITPPGNYRIVVGLVDTEGQPLGPEVICGQVQVVR